MLATPSPTWHLASQDRGVPRPDRQALQAPSRIDARTPLQFPRYMPEEFLGYRRGDIYKTAERVVRLSLIEWSAEILSVASSFQSFETNNRSLECRGINANDRLATIPRMRVADSSGQSAGYPKLRPNFSCVASQSNSPTDVAGGRIRPSRARARKDLRNNPNRWQSDQGMRSASNIQLCRKLGRI